MAIGTWGVVMFERRCAERCRTLVGAVVATVLLSGPWLQVGFDARHTRTNVLEHELTVANVASLRRTWSVTVPAEASEPIVTRNRVYVTLTNTVSGSAFVGVRALRLKDGTTAWDRTLVSSPNAGFVFSAPVAFVGDQLASGYGTAVFSPFSTDCALVRLDPHTGAVVSSERTAWPSSPFVTAGSHVAQITFPAATNCSPSFLPTLVVRDKETFGAQWTATLGTSASNAALPTVARGQIFAASGSHLMAFPVGGCGAPTCTPTWNADLGGFLTLPVPVAGPGRQLFIDAGGLTAVDQQTGEVRWKAPLPGSATGIAVAEPTVYVTTVGPEAAGDTLQAFAAHGCGATTCSPLWTAALESPSSAPPVVAGGVVYAGSTGAVRAFDADGCGAPTCPELAHVAVDGIPRNLSVARGRLLVTSTPDGSTASNTIAAFVPASATDVEAR